MYSSLLPAKSSNLCLKHTGISRKQHHSVSSSHKCKHTLRGKCRESSSWMQHPQKQGHTAIGKESEEYCQNSHFAPQYLKLSSPIFVNPSRECGCHSAPSPGNSVRKTTPVVTGQPPEGPDIDALTMPRCLSFWARLRQQVGLEMLQ